MGQAKSSGFAKKKEGMNRDLIEFELIEQFHWLPQDIAKIPYKSLQKFFLIRQHKQIGLETQKGIDQANKDMKDLVNPKNKGVKKIRR